MGNETSMSYRPLDPLNAGIGCPHCYRDFKIPPAFLAHLEPGSGYDCLCPFCDGSVKVHYNLKVLRLRRVDINAPILQVVKKY